MRPFVTALACVALLFVASAANAAEEKSFGQTVFDQAMSQAQEVGEAVQLAAEEIPQLCAVAAEASVEPEIVNSNYARFMELGQTFMLGMQLIGEAQVEVLLAETDAEYLDATKKVLLGKRAFDRVDAELKEIAKALRLATKQVGPKEA